MFFLLRIHCSFSSGVEFMAADQPNFRKICSVSLCLVSLLELMAELCLRMTLKGGRLLIKSDYTVLMLYFYILFTGQDLALLNILRYILSFKCY